jgi:hypothetical protein
VIAPSSISLSLQGRVRLLCVLALAAGAAPRALAQQAAGPEPACKCRPKLAGECFTVRGRVSVYRTAPTVRIAVVGTKRVLGLEGGVPEFLEEDLEVPGNAVVGDFLVCPLTRRKAGTIQLVCIESSSNMVLTEKR